MLEWEDYEPISVYFRGQALNIRLRETRKSKLHMHLSATSVKIWYHKDKRKVSGISNTFTNVAKIRHLRCNLRITNL